MVKKHIINMVKKHIINMDKITVVIYVQDPPK